MDVDPIADTNRYLDFLCAGLKHSLPAEFQNFPILKAGPGTLPPTLQTERFAKLYVEWEEHIAKWEKDGGPRENREFSLMFPNSILANQIELIIGEEYRARWQDFLKPYWLKSARAGYQMLKPQLDALVDGLVQTKKYLSPKGPRCVAIPVLPVGNCIAVNALAVIYRRLGYHVVMPMWNLPRNDGRRRDVVRQKVAELLKDESLYLHYVDEWNSGTNFSNIAKEIVKAKWPIERLFVTAIGNENRGAPKEYGETSKWMQERMGCAPALCWFISIPLAAYAGIDHGGENIFSENFSRIAGWRKISPFQFVNQVVAFADETLADIPVAAAKLSELSKKLPPEAFIPRLEGESKILGEYRSGFWRLFEGTYETFFRGAPYIFASDDDTTFAAINAEEVKFVELTLKDILPSITILISQKLKALEEDRPLVSTMPSLRSGTRVAYNLIRLVDSESGPTAAFEQIVRDRAIERLQ